MAIRLPGLATFGTSGAAVESDESNRSLAADLVVGLAVMLGLWLVVVLGRRMSGPIGAIGTPTVLSTNPYMLPYYAARSLLRMFLALFASTIFALIYGYIAARSRRAEKVLVPLLDILQSVPILGFLSVTLTFWLALVPGREFGVELASIFAIFTSQAWNMAFAFYQSMSSQSRDYDEVARMLRLTKWQRFWKLDVPNGMIPLVWNGMMSFGGGWFFLIASEVIAVNNDVYALPGIGSFVAAASERQEMSRILMAIAAMIIMVVLVNFVFWRPMTAWAEKFRLGDTQVTQQRSLVLDLLRRSVIPASAAAAFAPLGRAMYRATKPLGVTDRPLRVDYRRRRVGDIIAIILGAALLGVGLVWMLMYLQNSVGLGEFVHAFILGWLTFARVAVLLVLATLIWVPVGIWIGLNPEVTRFAQPIIQVLASFPAN
ncbi:MAG: ABC transporter permease subunit, partial [Cellulomonadaceae bacterium]|nr:ABC transporter permease subunit [Cellulomonadaceae bacterium]